MVESEGVAMLRALAEQNALRVFAEVVAVTGNGLPKRSESSTSIHYVTATGDVALYRAAGQCCSEGVEALDGGGTCDREE